MLPIRWLPQALEDLREVVAYREYLVFYRVTEHAVEIVNVVHGRRKFPIPHP